MIKTLEIQNFQGHKNSILEFSEGVNIIKGTTHCGKSVIIRALDWVIQNNGTLGMKSWWATNKDPMNVGIELDNDYVIRERIGTENTYETEENHFDAVSGNVPDEIQAILNMNSLNIQTQEEKYFLFNKSSGFVSKELNKAANISIIDQAISKVKGLVSSAKADQKSIKTDIETLKEEIEDFNYLDEIKDKIENLKGLSVLQDQNELDLLEINSLVGKIKKEELSIDRLTPIINRKNQLQVLEKSIVSFDTLTNNLNQIKKVTSQLIETENKLKKDQEILKSKERVEELEINIGKLIEINSKRVKIKKLSQDIENENKRNTKALTQLNELKKSKEKIISVIIDQKLVCTECNRPYTIENLEEN